MMPAREIEIDDDIVGMHMVRRPEYNGMVGTVESVIVGGVMVNGEVVASTRRYLILWADGARSLQHEWQVRLVDVAEEAFAHACAMEILSKVK